jgi:hypothetical protein
MAASESLVGHAARREFDDEQCAKRRYGSCTHRRDSYIVDTHAASASAWK